MAHRAGRRRCTPAAGGVCAGSRCERPVLPAGLSRMSMLFLGWQRPVTTALKFLSPTVLGPVNVVRGRSGFITGISAFEGHWCVAHVVAPIDVLRSTVGGFILPGEAWHLGHPDSRLEEVRGVAYPFRVTSVGTGDTRRFGGARGG